MSSSGQHLISADGHLDPEVLPKDVFLSHGDERLPKVEKIDGVDKWVVDGTIVGEWGPKRVREILAVGRRGQRMQEQGYVADELRAGDPKRRLEDLDKDGVQAEVIYGAPRRWGYLGGVDPSIARKTIHIYNAWVQAFCQNAPERLFAVGSVPPFDPESVVEEVRHIADLGLAGVEFPARLAERSALWEMEWDPMWAACSEAGLALHIHIGAPPQLWEPGVITDMILEGHVSFGMAPIVSSLVIGGVLERHPELKVVFAESGIGWIPYLADRLDIEWENRYDRSPFCSEQPSFYIQRQLLGTFQEDYVGPGLAAKFPTSFMWGADYPHPDGVWPDSHEKLDEMMQDVPEGLALRMTAGNAAELYGISSNIDQVVAG